jgi:hypothetical protein
VSEANYVHFLPFSGNFLSQILQLTTEHTVQQSRNQNKYNHEEHEE